MKKDKYKEVKVSEMTLKDKERFFKWYHKRIPIQFLDIEDKEWKDFTCVPMFTKNAIYRRKKETRSEKLDRLSKHIISKELEVLKIKLLNNKEFLEITYKYPEWYFYIDIKFYQNT